MSRLPDSPWIYWGRFIGFIGDGSNSDLSSGVFPTSATVIPALGGDLPKPEVEPDGWLA